MSAYRPPHTTAMTATTAAPIFNVFLELNTKRTPPGLGD
jgi:hypothetical protein